MNWYLGDGGEFAIELSFELGDANECDSDRSAKVDFVCGFVLREVVLGPFDGA